MYEIKITTTDDVKNLLRMYTASAALSTALELHLFEKLDNKPSNAQDVSQVLNIPTDRCQCWLDLLVGLGLLRKDNETYSISPVARKTIMDYYNHDTWAFLAQVGRERYITCNNLTLHITHPKSVWKAQGLNPPDWFKQNKEDPDQARRFTHTLYEIHLPLGKILAQTLDMTGVSRLLDLGGGSGVMSLELLKEHSEMTAMVIDIPNVCSIGREIADRTSVANRIIYHAADFLKDELPTDFDMILQCDAGIYTEKFFRKLHDALKEEGRLVIVDWWNHGITECMPVPNSSLQRLMFRFESSLAVSKLAKNSLSKVKSLLIKGGFHSVSEQSLDDNTFILTAYKTPPETN